MMSETVNEEGAQWKRSLNYTKQHISFSWVKFCTNLIITIKQATSQQHEYARLYKKNVSAAEI
jgi:hypothetical protein